MSGLTAAGPLPISGFVLAGGKSSRMGRDKASLPFRGRPLVEIAVEKLRGFCTEVGIVGNRDDLDRFAPVTHEARMNVGPAAGIEAGLRAAHEPWAMFVPVDVPLVPMAFLQRYAMTVLEMAGGGGIAISHLLVAGDQPAFCMLRTDCAAAFSAALDAGVQRLTTLFDLSRGERVHTVHDLHSLYGFPEYCGPGDAVAESWFANINLPEDLTAAESCVTEAWDG